MEAQKRVALNRKRGKDGATEKSLGELDDLLRSTSLDDNNEDADSIDENEAAQVGQQSFEDDEEDLEQRYRGNTMRRRQLSQQGQQLFFQAVNTTSTSVQEQSPSPAQAIGFQKSKSELQRMIDERLAGRAKSNHSDGDEKMLPRRESSTRFTTAWRLPSEQKVYFNYTAMNTPRISAGNPMGRKPSSKFFPSGEYDAVFEQNRMMRKKFSKGPEAFHGLDEVVW